MYYFLGSSYEFCEIVYTISLMVYRKKLNLSKLNDGPKEVNRLESKLRSVHLHRHHS